MIENPALEASGYGTTAPAGLSRSVSPNLRIINYEWFTDDPRRGQTALTLIAFVVAAGIVALGRKRLLWAIPLAFIWLLLAAVAIPSYTPARPVAYRMPVSTTFG